MRGYVLLDRACNRSVLRPAAAMMGRCRYFQFCQDWGSLSDAKIAEGVHLARQAMQVGKTIRKPFPWRL